jgi:branched-chain amino acid transport system permease protein
MTITRIAWLLSLILLVCLPMLLSEHRIHVAIQILLFAYLSLCWNILGGFAGQLSFGHALFMAVGAYTSTLLLLRLDISPWFGMIAGGTLAALLGLFIGYLSFRYRIKGTYFALVTLAFTEVARIIALNTDAVGGALGLYIPIQGDDLWQLKFVHKSQYYYVALGFLLLVMGVTAWLENSAFGHKLVAIRENEDAAQALGISLLRYKLSATALSAFLVALGGTLYAHYVTFIDPNTLLNMNMALEITIYAIVGGIGTLLGPVLGAVFLVPMAEMVRASLGQSYSGVHLVVYGAVLIAVILYAPNGFMGVIRSWLSSRRKSGPAESASSPITAARA